MPLWRIQPVARPGDPRWQGRAIWRDVVVRAPSAAFARLVARKLDEPPVRRRLGNETHCFRSGFEDEKLYWVRRLAPAEASAYQNVDPLDGVIVALPWSDDAGTADPLAEAAEPHMILANGTTRPGSAARAAGAKL